MRNATRRNYVAESEKLRLRLTEPDDLDFVLRTEQDAENRLYVSQWPREQHLSAISDPDQLHLIVEDRLAGVPVGYVILAGLDNPHHCVELRRIALAVRGKGIGKEALRIVIGWTFEEQGAHRLWLDVKDFNARARHVYASLGFVEEGTLRECIRSGDRYESLVIMAMLKREFEQRFRA